MVKEICSFWHHESVYGEEDKDRHILKLGKGWKWEIRFRPWRIYRVETPLVAQWLEPVWRCIQQKSLLFKPKLAKRFLGHWVRRTVAAVCANRIHDLWLDAHKQNSNLTWPQWTNEIGSVIKKCFMVDRTVRKKQTYMKVERTFPFTKNRDLKMDTGRTDNRGNWRENSVERRNQEKNDEKKMG